MRLTGWRRVIAVVALIVGIGAGASSVPASAAPANHQVVRMADIWW
jgi:hypothetical protein